MLVSRRTIHIEWGDCDPLGIVYYPRYFEFFDACTVGLFEKVGLPKPQLLAKYQIAGIPMVETHASFLAPARFGDTVRVESRIATWGKSSFSVEHKLFNGETLAVECREKRVWTVHAPGSERKIRSQEIPRELIEKFQTASQ